MRAAFSIALVLLAAACWWQPLSGVAAPVCTASSSQEQQPPHILVEAVVVDRDGKAVTDLGPSDFTVTIERTPRRVLWVKHVSRGPGALEEAGVWQAAADGAAVSPGVSFAAEPARNVLVVIDQATLARGREKAVVQAAGALLDRLGLDDRVAVVRVPIPADSLLTLTIERPEARETLRLVAGQATPATAIATNASALDTADKAIGAVDPDREKTADPERQVDPLSLQEEAARRVDEVEQPVTGTLRELAGLLGAIQAIPGRKTVALFSSGIIGGSQAAVEETALAALASQAVIHAFAIEGSSGGGDLRLAPDRSALERLAKMTGGLYVEPGRNPERAVERMLPSLSSRYVVAVEAGPEEGERGRQPALRVETRRSRTTVEAAAWVVEAGDPGDLAPPRPVPPDFPPDEPAADSPEPRRRESPEERAAREAELNMAMGRLVAYVNGYRRQYSALVAEEEYWQQDSGSKRSLRSDVLLVQPSGAQEEWVSFRDVFEVNGQMVRDREDRLRRLFLEASPEANAQLMQIKTESSRFNIGQIERNINTPFFTLKFLTDDNRDRFDFRMAGRQKVSGVEAWRIDYVEQTTPTVVRQNDGKDAPATGYFLVDTLTGAVVEAKMQLPVGDARGEFVVRFRRDQTIGLWVPTEMRETYTTQAATWFPGRQGFGTYDTRWVTLTEARATYSNFRRFQVRTEQQITIPKK